MAQMSHGTDLGIQMWAGISELQNGIHARLTVNFSLAYIALLSQSRHWLKIDLMSKASTERIVAIRIELF